MKSLFFFVSVVLTMQLGNANNKVCNTFTLERPSGTSTNVTNPVQWKAKLGMEFGEISTNIVFDSIHIWFASSEEILYCANISDGYKQYQYSAPSGDASFSCVFEHDNMIVYKSSLGLACLEKETGKVLWNIDVPKYQKCIMSDDGTLFLIHDSNIDCIDIVNGSTKWSRELEDEVINAKPTLKGLIVTFPKTRVRYGSFVLDPTNVLSLIDYTSGTILWSTVNADTDNFFLSDGNILTKQAKNLYCYDITTGKVLWQHNDDNFLYIIDANDEYAIINSRDGMSDNEKATICIDSKTGNIVWKMKDKFPNVKIIRSNKALFWYAGSSTNDMFTISTLDTNKELFRYTPDDKPLKILEVFVSGFMVCVETADNFLLFDANTSNMLPSIAKSTYYDGIFSLDDKMLYMGNGTIFILGHGLCIQGFDLVQGKKICTIETGAFRPSHVVVSKDLILTQANSFPKKSPAVLFCVSKNNGELKWKRSFGSWTFASKTIVKCNSVYIMYQTVYEKCQVECLDIDTGQTVWKTEVADSLRDWNWRWLELKCFDNKLYLSTDPGLVCCLDEVDGKVLWTWRSEKPLLPKCCLSKDLCVVSTEDQELICLDSDTGKYRWTFNKKDKDTYVEPSNWDFDLSGNKVFLAVQNVFEVCIYGVDSNNGKQLWVYRHEEGENIRFLKYINGKVYSSFHYLVIDGDFIEKDCLLCLEASTGVKKWQHALDRPLEDDPLITTKYILFTTKTLFSKDDHYEEEGQYHCLDRYSGKTVWKINCGEQCPMYSFSAVSEKWAVSIGFDSKLHCMDVSTGKETLSCDVGSYLPLPVHIENDNIYVSSRNGFLYCIKH